MLTDINECVKYADQPASGGGMGCDQTCVNVLLSFNCSCNEGYSLHIDGKRCIGKIQNLTEPIACRAKSSWYVQHINNLVYRLFNSTYIYVANFSVIGIDHSVKEVSNEIMEFERQWHLAGTWQDLLSGQSIIIPCNAVIACQLLAQVRQRIHYSS